MKILIPIFAVAALMGGAAFAQNGSPSSATKEFVTKAEAGTHFEVEAAKVALQQSKNPAVKSFARIMIKDHTKAGHMLQATVKSDKAAGLPDDTPLDNQQTQKLDQLKNAQAGEFDKQYVKIMLDDHQEDAQDFDDYAKNGDDAKIKAFARKTAPVIRKHLKTVQALQTKMDRSAKL